MKQFAVALTFVAVLGTASAQSLRSELDAANRAVGKMMMARDIKGFTKVMKATVTPDFVYAEAGRTLTFDQMCAEMGMGMSQMKKMHKAESKTLSLVEKGNAATVMTSHHMSGTMIGPDKKTHVMTFTGTSKDTYVKKGGAWKMSKMAWVKQTMLLDGKPFDPMAPAAK